MLNRADIILTHGGGLTSRVIRRFTRSYWNHAAIVFVLSDKAKASRGEQPQGYQSTFILEAEPQGVDAHSIDKYLYEDKQDMVILRFPDSILGFPGSPQPDARCDEFMRRVRGFALEEIDAVYGYRDLVRVALSKGEEILGPLNWVLKPVIRAIKVAGFNTNKAVNDFVCSGVVQYAYYRACRGVDPDDGTRWDSFFQDEKNLDNLIVNPDIRAAVNHQAQFSTIRAQLELTTPADFSRAAQANLLECVAERVKGVWGKQLTKV
jgi:hypothetical protein